MRAMPVIPKPLPPEVDQSKKMVLILKSYLSYVPGIIASLPINVANGLISSGAAIAFDPLNPPKR